MNAHRVRLDPFVLTVEPGREATCTVHVTNAGDVVDAFDIAILGGAAAWATVEPATVSLFPGAEGSARVTFRPPRSPEVPAGPVPFAVQVRSQDAGLNTSVVEEGTVEVGVYGEVEAELRPRTSQGRLGGGHRVVVTNRGNAPTAVRLSGSDDEQALQIKFSPPAVSLRPGSTGSAAVEVRCAKIALTGPARQWQFKVTTEAPTSPPVLLQGVMEQRPLLGRLTIRALAVATIAAVALAALHFKGADLRSAAGSLAASTAGRAGQVSPAAQLEPSAPGASPSAGTSPSPSPSAGGGTTGGGTTTGGGGTTTTAAAAAMVPATSCAGNPIGTSAPTALSAIPNLSVTVDNGGVPRTALVQLSANVGIDPDAEVRLAYSVDGAAAQENAYGPANLANHQQYYETRATTAVIPLGAGGHTIAAFWRVSGAAGRAASMDRRCLTVRSVLATPPAASPIVAGAACAGNGIVTSAPAGLAAIPGLAVTVDNGGAARTALVNVSANVGVDADAEVRLAYSVDGGPAQENAFGPANLANHQQYFETRDVTAAIPLAAGTHTIAALWRISGATGKKGTMDKRCLTVESAASGAVAAACAQTAATAASPAGAVPIPNLSITVNNGSASRRVLVEVSANMGVDADAEVRLAYAIDGGPAQENVFGPANLANHQQYFEARDATAVIPLGPGSHTITPTWRVNGAAGKTATLDKRCVTVESVPA